MERQNTLFKYYTPMECVSYIHNTSHEYGKLGPKGKKCIFIRYSEFSKGYVFLGEDINGIVWTLPDPRADATRY